METEFDRKVAVLLDKEPRFHREVYCFIAEAVNFTVSKKKVRGHVSAAQLLDGIREFAVFKYGTVADIVMAQWGLSMEADAGKVVYLLIGVRLLSASEDDRPEDFNTGKPLFGKVPQIRSVRRKSDNWPCIDA
jgi:uncharacterized repeat protein (TIGR04138 family)